MDPRDSAPKRYYDRFCRFCTVGLRPCDQHTQTDTQTSLRATGVAIGRILCTERLPNCLNGSLPGPFLLSYSVFILFFLIFSFLGRALD